MKIGIVTPYFYPLAGGVQEHVANFYLNLQSLGHEVKIITPSFLSKNRGIEFDEKDVIRIGLALPVPINGSFGQFSIPWGLRPRVRAMLSHQRFDILHLHEPLIPSLSLSILKAAECKIIGTFHAGAPNSPGYWLGRSFLRRYFERLDGRIAVSAAARDFVVRYFGGEFEIIPNGVDLERFRQGKIIESYNDDWINLLFVGRPDPRKGLPYLLKAFDIIRNEFKKVRLIVVGPDKGVKREAARDNIHFVGFQHKHLPDYYKTAHIFCSPATGRESFGIILIEAMAAGLPVVASDIPGYNEVIISGREGILVPPKDPISLARTLGTLISDNNLRTEMGLRATKRAEEFSWPKVTNSILNYYQQVTANVK